MTVNSKKSHCIHIKRTVNSKKYIVHIEYTKWVTLVYTRREANKEYTSYKVAVHKMKKWWPTQSRGAQRYNIFPEQNEVQYDKAELKDIKKALVSSSDLAIPRDSEWN